MFSDPSLKRFLIEINNLFTFNNYNKAVQKVREQFIFSRTVEEKIFLHLISAYLYLKLKDLFNSEVEFNNVINLLKLVKPRIIYYEFLTHYGISECFYSAGKFKQAFESRSLAQNLKMNIDLSSSNVTSEVIDTLNKVSELLTPKYDLIKDYKTKINTDKRKSLISLLMNKGRISYDSGDFKKAIKAIRRAEKYS